MKNYWQLTVEVERGFVIFKTPVRHILGFVMSRVCYVKGLSCLAFVCLGSVMVPPIRVTKY